MLAGSDFIRTYQQSSDFYVVSSLDTPSNLQGNQKKGLFSIGVLLLMIFMVTVGWLSMFKAMLLAVLVLLVTKTITAEEAKKNIQFHVLLLIASAFGIGMAMTKSGLAKWIADGMLSIGEPYGIVVLILLVYLLTNIFTELITNSAAAVLMLPIGIEMASSLGRLYGICCHDCDSSIGKFYYPNWLSDEFNCIWTWRLSVHRLYQSRYTFELVSNDCNGKYCQCCLVLIT
ncbi:SLC13 family permease [Gracilibacillus sp. JCM 18860]|uniref:SLC13 family permease n=1 Tax=Gracilibacillus sp. JCM 18860 TaxID=1306159 RepID=UPI000A9FF127